jgi:DNA-binding NtrC family response regulator
MKENPEYSAEFPLRGLTILMADDEEKLRQVVVMMLEELGARVIAVDSCEEAIDIFDERTDSIDIIMLDLRMNGMDGEEAYGIIRGRYPDARVVLASGIQPDRELTDDLRERGGSFIEKPFDMDGLGRVLATVAGRH